MYLYTYIYIYLCIYIYMYVYIYICMYVYIYTYMYVYIYIDLFICILYDSMCSSSTCPCECTYKIIYTHTFFIYWLYLLHIHAHVHVYTYTLSHIDLNFTVPLGRSVACSKQKPHSSTPRDLSDPEKAVGWGSVMIVMGILPRVSPRNNGDGAWHVCLMWDDDPSCFSACWKQPSSFGFSIIQPSRAASGGIWRSPVHWEIGQRWVWRGRKDSAALIALINDWFHWLRHGQAKDWPSVRCCRYASLQISPN